ncbi:2OG-FeII_Oxy domain-containing protein/DIOX_N domain-containing protein [Cephalotus follicularis]|uniref:2OG-FeII_Oxy domain-containing protein/DIOX_N domain-containing protein n=1 Tax=Cephalotus follicularis TaxID=3775 RepID=A0A1Q3CSL5_CEPFO|nr:2OG-FeII_Oxy domain-containing protein/DIOX_N domain-containing protein [Cephalotus follicularis]
MAYVKGLVESKTLTSVPSKYVFRGIDAKEGISLEAETIPTIDFSMLTSGTPDQRSKVIQDIGYACREWGFFMVINHGVPETLREAMIRGGESFFNLPEEEKREYEGKKLFDPIRFGTSFNVSLDKTLFWRDYLKIHVHPSFAAPHKPHGFSKSVQEYCKRTREVANELLKGISKSLGLEESYINKRMDMESGSQLLVVNLYPPCPQPDVVMGLPPHSDHGLLTILMQNELGGLQVNHNGKWVPINPLPNSFLVNTGDHMEILTNGKYKSIIHRAMVNDKATRISIATAHGPPLDSIVSPAPELVMNSENQIPAFRGIKYRDYMELQQSIELNGKSCLDHVRI